MEEWTQIMLVGSSQLSIQFLIGALAIRWWTTPASTVHTLLTRDRGTARKGNVTMVGATKRFRYTGTH